MRKTQRIDSISLDETYYTSEGYLVDHPIVTTCGIFEYKNDDGSTRRELRLPEHVFDKKSLASYKGKPIIITHGAGEVDKGNVRQEQVGTIMSEGYRDGDSVRIEIIIHDTDALKRCGLKELSLGYALDSEEKPGTWEGEAYDCIQKDIEINHLAIVSSARAGESARLNIDSKDREILKGGRIVMGKYLNRFRNDEGELSPEELEAAIALYKEQKAAVQVSGEAADTDDVSSEEEKGKDPVDAVRANVDRRDSDTSMSPEDIIAEQKADLDMLLSEIDRMQASSDMTTDSEEENKDSDENEDSGEEHEDSDGAGKEKGVNMDSVDALFTARLDVVRMADRLNLDGVERLSLKEGKKRIIKAVNPNIRLDGKSNVYIEAAYDLAKNFLNNRKSTDAQRKALSGEKMRMDASAKSGSAEARGRMIKNMTGGN